MVVKSCDGRIQIWSLDLDLDSSRDIDPKRRSQQSQPEGSCQALVEVAPPVHLLVSQSIGCFLLTRPPHCCVLPTSLPSQTSFRLPGGRTAPATASTAPHAVGGGCLFNVSRDGGLLCAGTASGEVLVFDTGTGARVAVVGGLRAGRAVRCCGISADGRHLLAAAGKGFVFRFEYTVTGGHTGGESGEGDELLTGEATADPGQRGAEEDYVKLGPSRDAAGSGGDAAAEEGSSSGLQEGERGGGSGPRGRIVPIAPLDVDTAAQYGNGMRSEGPTSTGRGDEGFSGGRAIIGQRAHQDPSSPHEELERERIKGQTHPNNHESNVIQMGRLRMVV